MSCSPDEVVTAILAQVCHLVARCKTMGVWVGAILPVL